MQSFTQVSHTFPESLYNHPIVTLKTKTRVLSCIPIQRSLPRESLYNHPIVTLKNQNACFKLYTDTTISTERYIKLTLSRALFPFILKMVANHTDYSLLKHSHLLATTTGRFVFAKTNTPQFSSDSTKIH